jgi:hypothetical protein
MQVANLFINGSKVITKHEPILGEDIKLSLDRDFTYSCIDTKMDIEVKFYCASGKTEIDLAYEENGIEAFGEIEIVDDCGTLSQFFKFRLDFKSYKSNSEFTTLGITDINSDWKSTLTNEVNVSEYLGNVDDFYVRNLPLKYLYFSQNSQSYEKANTGLVIDIFENAGTSPKPDKITFIYPKTNTFLNELEDGVQLLSEIMDLQKLNFSNSFLKINPIFSSNPSGGTVSTPTSFYLARPDIEPTPIFENILEDGEITITTNGSQDLTIDYNGATAIMRMNLYEFKELICVGYKWEDEFIDCAYNQLNNTSLQIASIGTQLNYTSIGNKSFTFTFQVKKGQKVWIWYQMTQGQYLSITGDFHFQIDEYNLLIDRSIDIQFTITRNVLNTISSVADIEPYHTKTKAYNGASVLGALFQTDYNLCQTPCFVDLWFSRGDYLRNKVNVSDFIVKPSDFFAEFEKVVCCGLGYFYFNNGLTPQKRLMSVYDFYTDNVVPSQYIFNYPDLIDAEIKIEPFVSPYYKEIQIGYSNSKDTAEDVCKQNSYTIPNRSETIYSKVSDFIGSMFIIAKALRLGTDDKELEFDKNIFILSGTTIPASPVNYNVTLSQSTGFLADNVDLNPTNTNGINRRYATVFNLFRHLYKWGFSLFSNKDTLRVVKYERTTGAPIYDLEILDTSSLSTNPYYTGLSDCKLPALNFEKVDRTVDNMYSMIQSNMYVPSVITFSTAKLSTFDLIAMRAFQYDLFQVSDGTNTYYGNLISANLVNDVTEIKLLRRFKNGI